MKFYDLSVPISDKLPVWPGDPSISIKRTGKLEEGSPVNVSQIQMGTHTSTHVDAPYHFLRDGRKVDELELERLIGPAWVADCRGAEMVTAEVLDEANVPQGTTRLLLLTDNARHWDDPHHEFDKGFVAIAKSGAEWMVARGIVLVGLDYMSADAFDSDGSPAHHTLLPQGIIIVENLDLRDVPPNREYELICLPLKLAGSDGAPARVVLREP